MKKHVIKHEIKVKDYKNCLENNDRMLRSQQRFKSEACNVFAEKIKIFLSSNDDKRLQTIDEIMSYPCSINTRQDGKTIDKV